MEISCKIFRSHLDDYIDGELPMDIRIAMEKHAEACEGCAALLEQAIGLSGLCAALNDDLSVPLECQAAWRKAIRAEKKPFYRSGWVRTAGMAAAALVLCATVLGTVQMINERDYYDDWAGKEAVYSYSSYNEEADSYAVPMSVSGQSAMTTGTNGFRLESDGAVADTLQNQSGEQGSASVVVLRSAEREMRSRDFDNDLLWLQDLLSEYNAYYEERQISGQADDANRRLNAVIRVPSESLDAFLEALDQLGEMVTSAEYAEDVSDSYNDIASRLSALRSQLDQLNAMNKSAESVSDLIEISSRVADVMGDIEYYEGMIRSWDSRASYSTVTLTLREYAVAPAEKTATLGERMSAAFDDSVVWLGEVGQGLVVGAAMLLPRLVVWVPAIALIVLLVKALFFRRKQKNK